METGLMSYLRILQQSSDFKGALQPVYILTHTLPWAQAHANTAADSLCMCMGSHAFCVEAG